LQKNVQGTFYSASDLVAFLECEHLTRLDLLHLDAPMDKTQDSEEAELIQGKGYAHEARFLQRLRDQGFSVADITLAGGKSSDRAAATLAAMKSGVDIVFQGLLRSGNFVGHVDFLKKVSTPSALGAHSYEPMDTKLARTVRAKFLVQLSFYAWLTQEAQGAAPQNMHVVLGHNEERSFRCADYSRYFDNLKARFVASVSGQAPATYPDPCDKCDSCHWRAQCSDKRLADDHLSQVAGISKIQIHRLGLAGITTMKQLAQTPQAPQGARISPQSFARVQAQASIQHRGRVENRQIVDLLPLDPEGQRGFHRLPEPDAADIFFDMEGNPLEEGGLEYLFGNYVINAGKPEFVTFWAHDRAQEKIAFEQFIDWAVERLAKNPKAHIYHYAPYERTAMEKLMSVHGTREAQVDNLFRAGKFIDLYKVVREGIRVSEPRYSIKNIEHFYMPARTGDVKNAGASIVFYEKWKTERDQGLLKLIADYNYDDVLSTYKLLEWLLKMRPSGIPWAQTGLRDNGETVALGALSEAELALVPYHADLVNPLPADRTAWGVDERVSELTYQLLDFHRRAAKPEWWAMFARREATVDVLTESADCIGGMRLDPKTPPVLEKRSMKYTYVYPQQDTKLRTGSSCTRADDSKSLSSLEVFPDERIVTVKTLATNEPLPEFLSLGPGGPINAKPMVKALFRFADSARAQNGKYAALASLLRHDLPSIDGVAANSPIIPATGDPLPHIIRAVANMRETHLFLQGPPGAGKTYTGSHVIVDLIKRGFKVGVSSNSHHAINNLLSAVELVAAKAKLSIRGAKKSTKGESEHQGPQIINVYKNDPIFTENFQIVAGTSWLFAAEEMDQTLDYLFVDEAGQVAMGNLLAMGTCARNIVLMGDQMQLSQPTKGTHPGRSGESALDYLLEGKATIPPERGVFLGQTFRMHPSVCAFISDAVYDGRLLSHPSAHGQKLDLDANAHAALRPNGIHFVPVEHDHCSQDSAEEAAVVKDLYANLLTQGYIGKDGVARPITMDNILVVAPYNLQVNRLREALPQGARVGTVDKFQGQEAEVVLISMATSNGDNLPRDIEFLYSKNRLNVAISRAKCLAVLVANPALQSIKCGTPEQMAMVNTLCWAASM